MDPIAQRHKIGLAIAVAFVVVWMIGLTAQITIEHRAVGKLIQDQKTLERNQHDLRKHENEFMRDVALWCERGEKLRSPD